MRRSRLSSEELSDANAAPEGAEKGSMLHYLTEMDKNGGKVPKDFSEQSVPLRAAAELVRVAKSLIGYRIKWERSHFIPKKEQGAENIQQADIPEELGLEIYTYERNGLLFGVAFQGRAQKPLWQYRFRDESQRDRYVKQTIERREKWLEGKKEEREKRQQYKHDYQVGDFLYTSWGYDQTNIDFYEVVGVLEKSIIIREVASKIVRSKPPTDYVVPVAGKFTGPKMKKRVSPGGRVRIESFASASKWDGKPKYQTSSGWGH